MSMGDINLAKNMVLPAARRRSIYQWILTYLLVSLIMLPVIAYRATAKIREGLDLQVQAQAVEQRFRMQNPGQKNMIAYADSLRDMLQQDTRHAAAINGGLPSSAHSMLPLLDLLLHEGGIGVINRLSFEQEDRNKRPLLEFSLIAPADRAKPEAPELLRNWRNDPMLMRQFTAVVPVITERGTIDGKEVQVMRYRAVFKE